VEKVEVNRFHQRYKIGNTTVEVVAPHITEEERRRRLEEMQKVAWMVWDSLPDHEKERIHRKYTIDDTEDT
jgi:hypothetical protein